MSQQLIISTTGEVYTTRVAKDKGFTAADFTKVARQRDDVEVYRLSEIKWSALGRGYVVCFTKGEIKHAVISVHLLSRVQLSVDQLLALGISVKVVLGTLVFSDYEDAQAAEKMYIEQSRRLLGVKQI
jgi:hypothetical protein